MGTLYIGHCDTGCIPQDPNQFLTPYHNIEGDTALKGRLSFRDDDRSTWRRFKEVSDGAFTVNDIQQFLNSAGFMPRARQTPVFEYVTQSATRLFQEYLRTVEGFDNIVPDGFFGQTTFEHMQRWKSEGLSCPWAGGQQSSEYELWFNLLLSAQRTYQREKPLALQMVNRHSGPTDTKKIDEWTFDKSDIHLIGIRSGEDKKEEKRKSNDLFLLLVNGQVFKFWGSTDPSSAMTDRRDEAYLVEGQHKYRFSWHKVTNEKKIYRALRPYNDGVLVFRDRDDDNALTAADLKYGLDKQPNPTINIHWSGIGSSNWSAGCQVIAGSSYINHSGKVIDCSAFSATSYGELNKDKKKTKGAYNMLADLVLCYAGHGVDYLYYTLGRDDTLNLAEGLGSNYMRDTLSSLQV